MSATAVNGGSGGDQTSPLEANNIDQTNDQAQATVAAEERSFPKKAGAMEGSTPITGANKAEPASTIGAATGDFVVRCRGLPWSCTEDDIKEFLGPAGASVTEVHFTLNREGRPSGEAYIALSDDHSYQAALAKDRDNMGHRYIEVFPSKRTEMDHVIGARGNSGGSASAIGNEDGIVRLRGLPFGCTKEEIANFFLGMEIAPNGIVMPYDHRTGKSTGESYVCFVDKATAEKAIQKHMHNIQHRYIEVFRSSQAELDRAMRVMTHGFDPMDRRGGRRDEWDGGYGPSSRPGPYDRPGDYGMYRDGSRSVYNSMFGNDYGGGGGGGGYGGGGGGGWDYDGYGPRGGGGGGGYGAYGDDDGYYGRPAGGGPVRAGRGGRGGMGGYGRPPARSAADGGQAPVGKHCIKMRGLPYRASERDIIDFFAPLRVAKIHILTEYGSGRPSGESRVEFFTHLDAVEAMKRDREHMGARYVELFLESDASDRMLYPDYSRDSGY